MTEFDLVVLIIPCLIMMTIGIMAGENERYNICNKPYTKVAMYLVGFIIVYGLYVFVRVKYFN